jgi:hypothetical protein
MSLPANITSLLGNLEAAQQATPDTSTGDFLYLKMTKGGEWVYGSEDTEVASDSVFVIDPNSYAQGFVAWDDGSLVDERMAVAGSPAVTMADLPQLANGAKWDSQVAFALRGIEGGDEGVQLLYKVSSRGGKGAISELLGKIIARGKAGEAAVCPVVLLDTSSYKHKKFGKIYTPILTVDEWLDLPDPSGAAPAPAPVKAVAEPEPVVEPVAEPVEEPATTGRKKRSRRSA